MVNYVAFNGAANRELAEQFLTIANKQSGSTPQMIGHRLLAHSLLATGDIAEARTHYSRAIKLYDPAEHRPLVTRFGQDSLATSLCYRSFALWLLGFPDAAVTDTHQALVKAQEVAQAATLMNTLFLTSMVQVFCGNYSAAKAAADQLVTLADDKNAALWGAAGTLLRGWLFALTKRVPDAVRTITSGITSARSTGATLFLPFFELHLAQCKAQIGKLDDAWRYIDDAMTMTELTGGRWLEAEVNRMAGEIAIVSNGAEKAENYLEHALVVARKQQVMSLELRAAMSLARLWRSQGKPQQARELLAPVYGWFTEGFDTIDLKEAKALLEELAE
jgi:predicted ATPase